MCRYFELDDGGLTIYFQYAKVMCFYCQTYTYVQECRDDNHVAQTAQSEPHWLVTYLRVLLTRQRQNGRLKWRKLHTDCSVIVLMQYKLL